MAIDFPTSPSVGQVYVFGGVTYVFTASGVWSTSGAGLSVLAGGFVNTRVITSSTSYTPTAGTQFAIVECVGGGGGGGHAQWTADGQYMSAGGGGSGGYSRSCLTATQIGASQSITIGDGGVGGLVVQNNGSPGTDTSFGGIVIAKGGGGGGYTYASDGGDGGGGPGGVAGTGDIAAAGAPGGNGMFGSSGADVGRAGEGGSSYFGGGGPTPLFPILGDPDGLSGQNYGSGGSGGFVRAGGDGVSIGGTGSSGVVVITEYSIGVGAQGPQGIAGGVTTPLTPQGRLTLQTGTPVMTATQSAKTTLFYTPYCGNQIPIWNGTSWATSSFNELSNLTTASSGGNAGPAAVVANKNYDLYVWSNGGTITLTRGPAWTSDTVRAPATADPARQNGILLNAASITNGPAASRGTYVGTVRSNGSSQIDWVYGAVATGGSAGLFCVWNAYNRVNVISLTGDTAGTWTAGAAYASAAAGTRHSFVSGLAEDAFEATYTAFGAGGSASFTAFGIGFDVTSAKSGTTGFIQAGNSSSGTAKYGIPTQGFHFVAAIEFCPGGDGAVYSNPSAGTNLQSGLWFNFKM